MILILKFVRILFIVCLLLEFISLKAQNRNSIWCFGDSAGIDFGNLSMPLPFETGIESRGTCVSIADSSGSLLFYANTLADGSPSNAGVAYNRNHKVMLNGDSLNGNGLYEEMIIIPKPGSKNLYYLISIDIYHYSPVGTFYSLVDIEGDSGRGEIVLKNIQISGDSVCGAMAAVKHGNGRDWWLIIKGYSEVGDSTFYEYLITPDSIIRRTINIGGFTWTPLGNLCFSKNGNKISYASFTGLIETFDFNRCTGDFTNSNIIHPQYAQNIALYSGLCFSPNNNLLYVSDANDDSHLFQFDLTSPNAWSSRDTLATITTSRGAGGNLRLGPDEKIYWSCESSPSGWWPYPYQPFMYSTYNMNLSVINNPNVQGSGCNLDLFSFYLGGKRTYWGLPNNPDYEMGALHGSICDSLSIGIEEVETSNLISVYPNPASNYFTVHLKFIPENDFRLQLTDLTGRVLLQHSLEKGTDQIPINCENLESGSYIIQLNSFNKLISEQKVIITK